MYFPEEVADYSSQKLILVKEEGTTPITVQSKWIKGDYSYGRRDFFLELDEDLEAGTYYVFVDFDWLPDTKAHEFGITCYGPDEVVMDEVTDDFNLYDFLFPAFVSHEA